ncbi:hypothetical protein LEP1GSC170_0213 [Leptospira interrogans serovar Bataviae str. HAI135]|nr:hypothetical protein LEP1GSC170_0213 [Leptospira interrogans serovar Bataviae str. HAI135]
MSVPEEREFFILGRRRKLACFGLEKNGYETKNLGSLESFYHSGKKFYVINLDLNFQIF